MKPNYTYQNSSDFIEDLDFAYLETYSLQRGQEFDDELKSLESEFDNLNSRTDLNKVEKNRLKQIDELINYVQFVIDKNGKLHFSASKTNRFEKTESKSKLLIEILKTEAKIIADWMCAPIYRDAILFFDKNDDLINVLNICFSCERMATKMYNQIEADEKTYKLLRDFFSNIGHEIETESASC